MHERVNDSGVPEEENMSTSPEVNRYMTNSTCSPMSDYKEFIDGKNVTSRISGFDCDEDSFPINMFPFQKACVKWALKRGRAALFESTGLGKTIQQAEWSAQVVDHTGGDVIIMAPLCVAHQTVAEAAKFGVVINYCRNQSDVRPGISITNYERIGSFNTERFVGVVGDELSIIKHVGSKTRMSVIDAFKDTPYRLSCTATPSPNDHMELGSQSEFLGIMKANEMLAMYFTHDGGNTAKWRLKKHGKTKFWEWMASWAICINTPYDLGFDGSAYDLPGIAMHDHVVDASVKSEGLIGHAIAKTLSERRIAKRQSIDERVAVAANLANGTSDPFIVWCHLNDESRALSESIPDSVEVYGTLPIEEKERRIGAFSRGDARVIITKPTITGFGLNWQHCHNMAFVGLNDSFEQFYQAIRRCHRFGQENIVNVHIISSSAEGAVKENLARKQDQNEEMASSMIAHMRNITKQQIQGADVDKPSYDRDCAAGHHWTLHLGDCVDVVSEINDGEIDYTIFSPPFSSLYTYSNSDRDMGNSLNDAQFYSHFKFLVREMYRATKPGRLLSFHCMNLPAFKSRDGFIGIKDFRGDLIRIFQDSGWIFHSEVCIWKNPVTAMQRTKAIGLLWKQLKKDSSLSRQGIPDYVVTMKKPGENPDRITKTAEGFPVDKWQEYASPVWSDINPSRTLQHRTARENDDERHIAPLQLDVIERCMEIWTNPGDLVLSPFAGIGSEGYVALNMGRKFIGAELKRSYWQCAIGNLESTDREQVDLFGRDQSNRG